MRPTATRLHPDLHTDVLVSPAPRYWKGEINMRGVSVARRQHGRGTMRFPDRAKGIYVGEWLQGAPHGRGMQLTGAKARVSLLGVMCFVLLVPHRVIQQRHVAQRGDARVHGS